jgi:hypothetical protein
MEAPWYKAPIHRIKHVWYAVSNITLFYTQLTIEMSSFASSTELDIFSPTTSSLQLTEDPPSGGGGSSGPANTGTAVGLSNPQLSQGRRRMLDLVNRLHTTGYDLNPFLTFNSYKCSPIIASR